MSALDIPMLSGALAFLGTVRATVCFLIDAYTPKCYDQSPQKFERPWYFLKVLGAFVFRREAARNDVIFGRESY